METKYRVVKIGNFLKRIKRPVDLEPTKDYKLVTVKLHHCGVTLRETKKGSEIKSKMYEVKAGDFILSGIDARNGAFGIVPEELDGAIVTNDFWYFDLDEEIIDKHFFLELTATDWFDEICKKGSDGTTQRIRLQNDRFFDQTIKLPNRAKQNELLTTFKRLQHLIEQINTQVTGNLNLISLFNQQILQDRAYGFVKLREHLKHLSNRINENEPTHRMIGVSNESGITKLTTNKKDSFHKYKIVSKNCFIYNPMRINVGSIALYTGNDECITSPDYVVFKIKSTYPSNALLYYLKSKKGQQEVAENVQGTVRQRLYYENLCNVNIPNLIITEHDTINEMFINLEKIKSNLMRDQENLNLLKQVVLREIFNK